MLKIGDQVYIQLKIKDARRIVELMKNLDRLPSEKTKAYIYPACDEYVEIENIITNFEAVVRYMNDVPENQLCLLPAYDTMLYQLEEVLKMFIRSEDDLKIAPVGTTYHDFYDLRDWITAIIDICNENSAFG